MQALILYKNLNQTVAAASTYYQRANRLSSKHANEVRLAPALPG